MPNYLKKIISIVIIVTFVADPNIALAADSGIFNKQNDSSTLSPTLRMKSIDVNKEEKALNTTGIDEKDNISKDFRAQSRFLYVAGEIGKAIAKKEQLKLPMDDIQRIIIEKVPDIDATGFNYKKIGLKEGRYSLDYVDNDKPLLTLNYYFVKGDLAQGQIKVADVSEKGLLVFECNMPGMDGIASIKEKETSEPKIQNSVHKRIRMSKDEKRDVGEINAQNNGIDRKALRFTNVLEKRLNRVFTAAAVRQKTGRKVEIKITPVLRYGNNEAAAWTRGFTMRATRSDMTIIHEYSMVFDRTDLKEFLFTVRHDISRIEGLNDIADIPEWEDLMYDLALQPRTMDEATVVNTAQMEITKRYYRFNDPENLYVEHPAPVIFFSPVVNLLDIFPITVMMDIDGKPFYFLERNLGLVGLTMNSGVPHMVRFTQFEYAGRIRNGIEIVRFTDNYEPTAFILRGYIDLEKGFQIIHYTREENEMNKIRLPGMRNEVLEIEAMCNLWPRLSEEITRDKTETMTSEENKKNKKPELAPLYRDMGVILGTLVGAGLLYGQFGITGIPVAAAISVLTLLPGWLIHEIGHLIGRPFGKEAEIRAGPIASLLLFSAAIIPAIVLHSYGFPSVIIDVAAANYFVHIFADGQSLLKRSGFLHPEDVNDANIPEREDQDELTPGQKLINKIKEVSARGLADYGVIKTPLIPLDKISGMMSFNRKERKVFLKDEAWQTGGSFKARGVSVEVDDAIRSRIEAIIAEEPHLQEIKASGKTPLKERPFYIVTQTTGNHGIALINAVNVAIKIYSEKYPEYKEAITNFEPVIFTIKNLPEIKFKLMTEAVEIYRKTSGKTESETIRNYYENYNKALTAREEFLREHSEDAVYMEHGGLAIMAGHATAGIEIDEQLTEEFGIGKDKNVVVIVPVGAGGPIGIGAGVKLNGRNVTFIAVGTKEYDAIIRSIDSSKVEWNKANPSPTAFIKGKPIIYPDGIAVDKSEKSAVDVARDFVDEKFVTSDKKGLNRAAPLLYSDLESYYMERAKPLAVGGTTAATLEALIENKGNEIMKNADVIVLFGTEGNVDPDITEYIYGLNSGNEPLKFGENGELTTQLIGKLKGYDIAARENIHGQRYSQAEVFIEKQRWVLKNAAAWDKEAVDQARYVIGNYLSLVNSYCRAMKNENDQKIKTDMIESCEKLLKNTTSLYEKFKREGKILGCGAYIISAYTNLAGQYGNEDFYKIERLLDTAKEILDQGAADRYGDITTEGAREVIPPITKQAEFIITGYMKLAGKMKWQDDFANALRIAEKARDLLAKYRDAPGVENVFYDVGIFYVNLAAIYRDRFRDIVFSMAMLMKAESIRIEFGEYNSAQKGHSTGNRALSSSIINGYTLTARKFSEKKQYAAAVHAIRRSGVLTWRYGTDEYKENRDIVGLMVLANAVSNILRRDVLENKQEYLNNLNDAKRILWISAQVLRKYDTPSVKAQVEYLVSAYTNLSYSYKTVGEYGLCGDVLERVERILRSYPDQQSVRDQAEFVVSSFANLAGAYREAGDLETAEKFLNRAYKVFLNFIGEYSVQRQKKFMIDDHMRLSQAFEVKGDRQKAVELSDKALKIAQTKLDVEKHKRLRAMGPIPFEMFIVFLAYGSIYKHRKEIIDFIHSKGYLRLEKAVRLLIPDLSKYRVTEWLHESLQNISIGLTIKPVAIDQGMWDLEQRIPERGQSEEAKFIEMFGGHSEEVLEFITEERNCSEISGFSIKNVKHFETAENVSRNVYRIELVLKGGHNHVFYVREYRSTDGESQIGELDWITGPIRRMTDRVEKAAAAGMVAPYARLFIDRGRCLFVQDEAQGIPVKEFIKDEETALLAAESIGYALGRLHGLGIEHGDLEIERKGSPEHNHIFIHEENDGVTANFIDFYERPFSFWRRGKVKIFGEEDDLLNKLEKYVFGKIGSENRAENEIADVFTKAYIKGNVSVGEKYRPSLVAKIKMALGKFKEKVADRMLVHKIMANSVEAIHDEERLIEASGGEARIVRSANHGTQGTVQTGEADGENIVAADNEKNEGTVTAVNGAVVLGFSQANCWTPLALYAGLLIYSELYKHRKAIIDFIHSKGYLRLEKGVRILLPDLSKYRVTRMFHKSLMNMSIGGTIKETDESNKYDLEIRARLSEVDAYIGSNELDSAEKALKRAQSILFKYVGLYPDDANIRYIVLQFISAYGSLAENAISVGDSRESLEMAFRAYNAQYRILSLKAVQEEDRNKLVVHAMVGIAKLCGSFLDLSSGAQIARACAMAERAQEIFTENRNIQKVKKRAATCVKAFCKVSEAYSKSEKYDDALSMVDKAARALKNNEKEKGVRGLMREVVRLYMSGLDEMCGNEDKLKKLMNEFRDRLKSDPSDPVTEMIFAYMMLISGNTSNAVAYAMDGITNSDNVLLDIGNQIVRTGNMIEMIGKVQDAAELIDLRIRIEEELSPGNLKDRCISEWDKRNAQLGGSEYVALNKQEHVLTVPGDGAKTVLNSVSVQEGEKRNDLPRRALIELYRQIDECMKGFYDAVSHNETDKAEGLLGKAKEALDEIIEEYPDAHYLKTKFQTICIGYIKLGGVMAGQDKSMQDLSKAFRAFNAEHEMLVDAKYAAYRELKDIDNVLIRLMGRWRKLGRSFLQYSSKESTSIDTSAKAIEKSIEIFDMYKAGGGLPISAQDYVNDLCDISDAYIYSKSDNKAEEAMKATAAAEKLAMDNRSGCDSMEMLCKVIRQYQKCI
ncbi:MAG TPA: pyridoxal-phosphate dependent enzyme, partial [Candidatus Omnitrophota bacterium]|nr:pyridoxal-phosphate dependent enzyme [Candidatus Omnitrophota bacterium]